jgi:hypothetical protein
MSLPTTTRGKDKMNPLVVTIPGQMYARVRDGKIVNFIFTPSAADAGYFGEPFYVIDNSENQLEPLEEEFWDMVSTKLSATNGSEFLCEWEC